MTFLFCMVNLKLLIAMALVQTLFGPAIMIIWEKVVILFSVGNSDENVNCFEDKHIHFNVFIKDIN